MVTQTQHDRPPPATDDYDADRNIHARMLRVVNAITNIEKSGTAPEAIGGFPFVEAPVAKAAIRHELIRNGIMVHASITDVETEQLQGREGRRAILATVKGTLAFVNVDDPKQVAANEIVGQGVDYGDKAVSKATTSAIKYGLLNAFTIPTGIDPDASPDQLPSANGRAPQAAAAGPHGSEWSPGPPEDEPPPYGAHPPPQPQQQQRYRSTQYEDYAQDQQRGPRPAPQGAGGDRCPAHDRKWKMGTYGWYCTGKGGDGPLNDRGYCTLTPSAEWAARHE